MTCSAVRWPQAWPASLLSELTVPVTPPADVERITEEVLARPEFLQAQPSWLQQVLRWIFDMVDEFVGTLGGGPRGSAIGTVVLVLIALLLAGVIIRYTRTMRRDRGLDAAVDAPVGRAADQWLEDAVGLEAAGNWRGALRCRYRALVAELAGAGLVEEVPGRTTGEYLAAVEADVPLAAGSFATATRTFESAWYGHADVNRDDVAEFAATAQRSLADAGLRRTAAAGVGA